MNSRSIPRIVSRKTSILSPWVRLVERHVDFGDGKIEVYHALDQDDYIAILAVTPDGLIPVVRQYRPALERFTLELPAGLVEPGETPEQTCIRELREETGLVSRTVHSLGVHAPDTARLSNKIFSFCVETYPYSDTRETEPQIEVNLVTFGRLCSSILAGDFDLQSHIGTVALAMLNPDLRSLLIPMNAL